MALLIDGQLNNTQDLRNYENGILDLASSENIDVTGKMALAQDEIGSVILNFLLKQTTRDLGSFPYLLGGESVRRRLGVSVVAITPQLKRWHALKTLTLVYTDAYNNQLNDRYRGKWQEYETFAADAERSFFEIGVGICMNPVGKAQPPILGFIAGTAAKATFFVQITLVSRIGQEGSPSDVASFSTPPSSQLTVGSSDTPANATGFNVYAGSTPDGVTLQNDAFIPFGSQWILSVSGLRPGRKAGQGQSADRYVVNNRILLRG